MDGREFRDSLVDHVGGAPNPVQSVLIERALMLRIHLGRMDREMVQQDRPVSAADRTQYLAWTRQLTAVLKAIGVERAEPRAGISLADVLGAAPPPVC